MRTDASLRGAVLLCLALFALPGCGREPTGASPPFEAHLPEPGVNNTWYSQASRDTVVVFVHGILSDSRGCWWYQDPEHKARNNFWPEIVKNDSTLGSPSIFLAGYYADVDSGIATIRDSAQQVWQDLSVPQGGQAPLEAKRILFITHSTGGIVARYLIEAYADQLREKVVGLMLIASPSGGSEAANELEEIIEMYNSELGRTLMTNSDILTDLDRRFKDLVTKVRLPFLVGIEAFEHQRVLHWKYMPNWKIFEVTRLVTRDSAGRYFGDARMLPETNHFSTVKPSGGSHPAHRLLLEFYQGKFAQVSDRARQVLEHPVVEATNVVEVTAENAADYQDIGNLTAHRLVVRDVEVKAREGSEVAANEIELVGSARITGREITLRVGRLKGGRIVADGANGQRSQPGRSGGRIYLAAGLSITGTALSARGGKGGDAVTDGAVGSPGGAGGIVYVSSVNTLDPLPDVNGGAGGQRAGPPGPLGKVYFTQFGDPIQARALATVADRSGLQQTLLAAAAPATVPDATIRFVGDNVSAASQKELDRIAAMLRDDAQFTLILRPPSWNATTMDAKAPFERADRMVAYLQKRGVDRHQITTYSAVVAARVGSGGLGTTTTDAAAWVVTQADRSKQPQ